MNSKLKELVEALDVESDTVHSYYNKVTGDVVIVTADEIQEYEELKEGEELEDEGLDVSIKEVLECPDYVRLPSKYAVHEWDIMNDFCDAIEDAKIKGFISRAMQGDGAFSRFYDQIHYHNIESEWFAYKEEALKKIILEWCETEGIEIKGSTSKIEYIQDYE